MSFYAVNGKYPSIGGACGGNTLDPTTISGLVPTHVNKLPSSPNDGIGGYYAYITSTNCVDYKIVRLVNTGVTLPTPEQSDPMPDATRPNRGWGMWSPGGSTL